MLELPETLTLARQINETISGKQILNVIAANTPHKFAWYYGNPQDYNNLLAGKVIGKATAYGGMVEIKADDAIILIGDGVGLRYHGQNESRPKKHQLLIEFQDYSAISATVQMYGGMWCFNDGDFENPYYKIAKVMPSPLSEVFDEKYFEGLFNAEGISKLSVKAFLATEQRIPGLGNGVLQDILWNAKIHPKRKMNTLEDVDVKRLFNSIKTTLDDMTVKGGRNTEKDLFGTIGGYETIMSKNNVGMPCPICGSLIKKENYMGGSIYYCDGCQK